MSGCEHKSTSRVSPLYVDGRPLHKCNDCEARFVYEDDEPSFKGLAPIKGAALASPTPMIEHGYVIRREQDAGGEGSEP